MVEESGSRLLRHRLISLDAWLGRRGVLMLGVLFAAIAALKGGFQGIYAPTWTLDSWPQPVGQYPFLNYGLRGFAWLVGTESSAAYVLFGFLALVVTVVVASLLFRGVFEDANVARWTIIIVLSGPIVWILAGRLIYTDAFVVLGGLILGTKGRHPVVAAAGILIAVLGNPEQAVVVAATALILSLSGPFRGWLGGAVTACVVAFACWLALNLWAASVGAITRLTGWQDLDSGAMFINFLRSFPLQIYAGMGLSLALVIWAMACQRRMLLNAVVLSVMIIPLAATALNADQTRVLVCASVAALAMVFSRYATSAYTELRRLSPFPLAATAIVCIFLPAIEITGDMIRVPWHLYYPVFQSYVMDWLPQLL